MSTSPLRISVVVPVLDEATGIEPQMRRLCALAGIDEILVVDGGSTDDTVARARAIGGVRVLAAPTGRAAQMNAGAEAACGDVLLFLHADVTLPEDAAAHVRRTLSDPEVIAGAFRTWTVPGDGGWPLGPLLHLADIRSRWGRLPYGDQALFVRADVFRELGGFADLPLMEDVDLAERLRHAGRIARVPARVVVSGRRFQARPVAYTLLVNAYPFLYRLGVPAAWLARFYGRVR